MKPLLLHACCAPCSLEPVRLLREEGFEPTICWTNPNIQPHDEWQRRLDELRRWCADGDIELIEAGEDRERWEAGVAPLAIAPWLAATFGVQQTLVGAGMVVTAVPAALLLFGRRHFDRAARQ